MTDQKRSMLSIKRKPKIYVDPKHANKPAPPPQPAKPVKETKSKQPPPKPLSREARNRAKKLR